MMVTEDQVYITAHRFVGPYDQNAPSIVVSGRDKHKRGLILLRTTTPDQPNLKERSDASHRRLSISRRKILALLLIIMTGTSVFSYYYYLMNVTSVNGITIGMVLANRVFLGG